MMQSFTKDQLKAIYNYKVIRAREDFLMYRILINPKLKINWYVIDISYKLQQFVFDLEDGLKPMMIIQAPPQHGKSEAIIDIISWIAGRNPNLKKIFASFSERLGIRANLKLQRTYTKKLYKDIFPNTNINNKNNATSVNYLRNREILEYVDKDGYFRNTTVQGSITGESLDLGIIDDPIKGRESANSETVRNKTWEWFTDDFFTRFSEQAGFLMILTRWHIDDPAGRLIERNKRIKLITYKAIAEEDEEHRLKGEALFPEHKSKEFLEERRALMHDTFEALYQQNPVLKTGNMFKVGMIEVVDSLPAGITQRVRGWDFASTIASGDATAGVKIEELNGIFFITDIIHFRGSPDEVETALVNTASLDGNRLLQSYPQDPGQAGKSQVAYLSKKLKGYKFEFTTENGNKETRADGFASQVNAGNVKMLRASWNFDYLEELRAFPFGKYDDRVDASSRAFNKLISWNDGVSSLLKKRIKR